MWTLVELHKTIETKDGAIFRTELLGRLYVKSGLTETERLELCRKYGGDQLCSLPTSVSSEMLISVLMPLSEPTTKFFPK